MKTKAKTEFIISMVIYGTIGIVRRWIPLPSSMLAFARALIGMLFLLAVLRLSGKKMDFSAVRKNARHLLIAGALLGFNWILLFEAYNYTTVAVATLCYYMAPIFMILASRVIFHEKVGRRKGICIALALVGMVFVTGVAEGGVSGTRGVLLGLAAAAMYACIVINNKMLKDISAYDRTIVQLFVSVVLLIPYVLLTENVAEVRWTPLSIVLVIAAGILHTGIAYALYFGNMDKIPTQEVAILSYIDPVVAVILSALVLNEHMSFLGIIGTVIVLVSLLVSELEKQ